MPSPWAFRLGRLLPASTRQDLFDPALCDLDHERASRLLPGDPAATSARTRLWYGVRVTGVFLECLRLLLYERLLARDFHPPAVNPRPRKEWLAMFWLDLRHALRLIRREPAFATAIVLTLALGIGANTALFAVVEAVLLRPLPYPEADRIVLVKHRDVGTGLTKSDVAMADFIDLRARQQSFEELAGYYPFQSSLIGEGEPRRILGITLTPGAIGVLGLQPVMGRAFRVEDVHTGAPPVVIVSHELWRTDLGSDPAVLTRTILIGTTRRLVVGVAPPGFRFPPSEPTDVLVPSAVPIATPSVRRSGWIYGIGRLKSGVPIDRAEKEVAAISEQLAREFPQQNGGSRYYTESLRDGLVGDTRRPLVMLLVSVGFVLLIACANVGNLLLARSLSRQSEMAMRLALGAGRGRLVAQTLTEGLVLALTGGMVGVLVAWQAAPALAALMPRAAELPGLDRVGLNGWVLAFSLGASFVAAIVSSGVACLGLTRETARAALVGQRRATSTASARRAASALVAAEIALAAVLLIGAGLAWRTFANVMAVDPGFTADGVITVQIGLPAGRYADQGARTAAYQRMFAALDAMPQVDTVGAAAVTPLTGNNWTASIVRADRPLVAGQRPPEVGWQSASGGYFSALRIPLRDGRVFDARDTLDGPPVVIVSDAIAERHFPGENPVGRRIMIGDVTAEIVGRVGDIRRASLTDAPRADLYFPFERQNGNGVTLFVRTVGDPLAVLPDIRATLRQVEPGVLVFQARTMSDIAAASAAVPRVAMRLLSGFALIALVLAAVGIYGVMSYTVRRRTREMGTRLALGASRRDIVMLLLRQAAVIAGIGLIVGIPIGLLAARALSSMLYGVTPWDPLALGLAGLVMAVTALGASYLPARRASLVDPATTLAAE